MPILQIGLSKKFMLGGRQKNNEAGFTLTEVLVTLAIVAIMAGTVVVTMPQGPSPLVKTGQDIAGFIEYISERSITQRRPLGVRIVEDRLEIVGALPRLEMSEGQDASGLWQALQTYQLPSGGAYQLSLSVNGAQINLKDSQKSELPVIVYSPTGLATPFDLIIDSAGKRLFLRGDTAGKVQLELPS